MAAVPVIAVHSLASTRTTIRSLHGHTPRGITDDAQIPDSISTEAGAGVVGFKISRSAFLYGIES